MESTHKIDLAITMATFAHTGQFDRQGQPYILHPLRVGAEGRTENDIIVGLLHDTLEDTELVPQDILHEFGTEVYDAVCALTRPKEKHDYMQHIREHVGPNPLASAVKMRDLQDNMSARRNNGSPRPIPKYIEALTYLQTLYT